MSTPTADTGELIAHASTIVKRMHRPVATYRKAGVPMAESCPVGQVQAGFVDAQDRERSAELMGVPDEINARTGHGALRYAAEGIAQEWKTRRENLSPNYTTRWDKLSVVWAKWCASSGRIGRPRLGQ